MDRGGETAGSVSKGLFIRWLGERSMNPIGDNTLGDLSQGNLLKLEHSLNEKKIAAEVIQLWLVRRLAFGFSGTLSCGIPLNRRPDVMSGLGVH